MEPPEDKLCRLLRDCAQQCEQVLQHQVCTPPNRTGLVRAREKHNTSRRLLEVSFEQMINTTTALTARPGEANNDFYRRHLEANRVHSEQQNLHSLAIEAYETAVMEHERCYGERENLLRESIQAFRTRIEGMLYESSSFTPNSVRNHVALESSTIHSFSTSEAHPLVREYWDRKGNVGIWTERLDELRHEYNYEFGENIMPHEAKQGMDLGEFTAKAEKAYDTQYRQIQSEIIDAMKLEHECLQRCYKAGVDLEFHSPENSEEAEAESDAISYHSNHENPGRTLVGIYSNDLGVSQSPSPGSDGPKVSEWPTTSRELNLSLAEYTRVEDWVQDVRLSDASTPSPTEADAPP